MTLHRIPVALALLSIAIAPLSLAAQGDTTKAAKKTTTTSTAKKSTKAASTTAASSAAAKPTTPAAIINPMQNFPQAPPSVKILYIRPAKRASRTSPTIAPPLMNSLGSYALILTPKLLPHACRISGHRGIGQCRRYVAIAEWANDPSVSAPRV